LGELRTQSNENNSTRNVVESKLLSNRSSKRDGRHGHGGEMGEEEKGVKGPFEASLRTKTCDLLDKTPRRSKCIVIRWTKRKKNQLPPFFAKAYRREKCQRNVL